MHVIAASSSVNADNMALHDELDNATLDLIKTITKDKKKPSYILSAWGRTRIAQAPPRKKISQSGRLVLNGPLVQVVPEIK